MSLSSLSPSSAPPTLKAVLFDRDDTLAVTDPAVYREAAQWLAGRFGLDPRHAGQTLAGLWQERMNDWWDLRSLEQEEQFWETYGGDLTARLGLDLAECQDIDCPRLAHAPASLECRLAQVVPLAGKDNRLMIAEVLAIHLRDDCVDDDGRFDVTRFAPLSRLGYLDFAAVDQVFALRRPKVD